MKYIAFDLETTGTDVATAEVVQSAVVIVEGNAHRKLDWSTAKTHSILCHVDHIPASATAVHGISGVDVVGCKPFSVYAQGLASKLSAEDTVVVTFNGAAYDLPILERYVGRELEFDHVDMYRAWMHARADDEVTAWQVDPDDPKPHALYPIGAECFSGSLAGAHAFYCGEGFADAHDAAADCKATLRVFEKAGEALSTLRAWTKEPLPGQVDFSGKFTWVDDHVAFGFGKHRGALIENVPRDYLTWMIEKGDFPRDTCALVRAYLQGQYPRKVSL